MAVKFALHLIPSTIKKVNLKVFENLLIGLNWSSIIWHLKTVAFILTAEHLTINPNTLVRNLLTSSYEINVAETVGGSCVSTIRTCINCAVSLLISRLVQLVLEPLWHQAAHVGMGA